MGITKERCRGVIRESSTLCNLAAVPVLFQCLPRVLVWKETTKYLLRPQVGGVVGNEVPGRVSGSWLSCSSTAQSQTLAWKRTWGHSGTRLLME